MGILSKLGGLLGRILGRKKPAVPEIKRKPMPSGLLGRPVDRGGVGHPRKLTPATVEGFVYDQELLPVASSNVVAAQYFVKENKMMVEYGAGGGKKSAYLYSNVSLDEAVSFATASSKGKWVWRNLRVLGSKTAHKKPYTKLGG